MRFLLTTILIFSISYSNGQNYWSESKSSENSRREALIKTSKSKIYDLDHNTFNGIFKINNIIKIPLPDGKFVSFNLTESRTMSPGLKNKYPNIKVFNGKSLDGKYFGTFDYTHKGFHAMIKSDAGLIFIDPTNSESSTYQVYNKSDFINTKSPQSNEDVLSQKGGKIDLSPKIQKAAFKNTSGTELRTYRTAITSTGEYTSFHGGTVADALAAIVTTLNRVNGIYEREVGIAFELISNTDLLIYTNSEADPYTNDDAGTYIDEVQANIDAIIGDANYDVGHGFSTGAGGLAGPGPCISGRKATGVTGTNSPIGDPYDVDYVAHEIGHQFGANHTFNGSTGSCSGGNRNASTAYEPGSGTTILAYAGICAPQNIQNNSDAFMHTASFDEIIEYSVNGSGNTCPTITSTGNNPPEVDAGIGDYIIPINTPFSLTGSATDPDGHSLTYSWEQFDLGPAGQPNSPVDNAPLFRSFSPSESPTRIFPQLSDILNGTQTMGEILPSYERTLTFRLTARDNQNGGGGVSYDEISLDVTDKAGPFTITSFNTQDTLASKTNTLIEWDVANTDIAPINCKKVNLLLSLDGGQNFDYVLKSNTINDGSEEVLLPEVTSSNARIKIEAVDNLFFDINNSKIIILEPSEADFNISLSEDEITLCGTEVKNLNIQIGSILGYTNEVILSHSSTDDGLVVEFGNNTVTPGNMTNISISNPDQTANGLYNLQIFANDGNNMKSYSLTINVYDGLSKDINILSPTNLESGIPISPIIIWDELVGNNQYSLDIATDNGFSNIISSNTNIKNGYFQVSGLAENTTHYLRVKGINECVESNYTTLEFTTAAIVCNTVSSSDVPISINSSTPNTINSTIIIDESGIIEDINILGLIGTHTYVGDLTVALKSPSGQSVTLFDGICDDLDNFNINFDDESVFSNIPCPPTDGGTYQPAGNLSDFDMENTAGTWILSITDNYNGDGGQLTNWSLEMCSVPSKPSPPSNLSATTANNTSIDLVWKDNSIDETSFEIERSVGDNLSYSNIGNASSNQTTFRDNNISISNVYYYRVRAVAGVNSNYSNEIKLSFKPLTPTNLTATTVTSSTVSLAWTDTNSDEDNYIIERSTPGTSFTTLTTVSANTETYLDENLNPNSSYIYRIKAQRGSDFSNYSSQLIVKTLPLPPAAPSNLIISANSINELVITWNDNSDNEDAFILERSLGGNGNYLEITSIESNVVEYIDNDVTELTDYFYRVFARNQGGDSEYSNEVNLSTLVLYTQDQVASSLIYPNPFSKKFTMLSKEPIDNKDITIYNSLGERIQYQSESSNNGLIINLSNHPDGVYYINQITKGNIEVYKLLKITNK